MITEYLKTHSLFMRAGLTVLEVLSQILLLAMSGWVQTTFLHKPNEGFVNNYGSLSPPRLKL